jgi:hypothetical protein
MHVSRVAAALLRIVRRSRRPLAIAVVSVLATGVCMVTGVSGAAMAAEQPRTTGTSAATTGAGSSSTTGVGSSSSNVSSADASASGSHQSSGASSTGSGTSTSSTAPSTKASSKPATTVKKSTNTAKLQAPIVSMPKAAHSSLVALAAPVITLSGTSAIADTNGDGRNSVGDVVTTTWTVTNTGPDPVTALSLTVSRGTATCATTTIPPTSSVTCTATTTVKQFDIDSAKVNVTGTANGTILGNPSASDPATVTRTLSVSAKLTIAQSILLVSDRDHDGATSKGDRLQFVFTVKNTGTQTLHGVLVTDSKLNNAGISIHCSTTTLAPGHSTTCRSGSYTVTSFDAKRGFVTNSAKARGTTPQGTHVFSAQSTRSKSVKHEIKLRANLNLTLSIASVKDNDGNGQPTVGDTVTYAFDISNTGNASVSGMFIVDDKLKRMGVAIHCGSSLAAGGSTRCESGPVKISGFNVKQGKLVNFATVHAITSSTGRAVQAFDGLDLSLNVPLSELVGRTSAASLPRTGGIPTQPITLAFWMILIGFGLVVAGRSPGRATATVRTDRGSTYVGEASRS